MLLPAVSVEEALQTGKLQSQAADEGTIHVEVGYMGPFIKTKSQGEALNASSISSRHCFVSLRIVAVDLSHDPHFAPLQCKQLRYPSRGTSDRADRSQWQI